MNHHISLENKIFLECDLSDHISVMARPLVMTNGVFDVIHRGHVSYLHRAAELGASLLVAINTDESARLLGKGPDRPLNSELDRAYVLAGLASVDMVTFFSTRSPVELIHKIKPEIYVKGGDYDMETLCRWVFYYCAGSTHTLTFALDVFFWSLVRKHHFRVVKC